MSALETRGFEGGSREWLEQKRQTERREARALGNARSNPARFGRTDNLVYGEVSEWPNERAWKARVPNGTAGSNPALSANLSF